MQLRDILTPDNQKPEELWDHVCPACSKKLGQKVISPNQYCRRCTTVCDKIIRDTGQRVVLNKETIGAARAIGGRFFI